MDEEDKTVERVWGTVPLVVLRIDGPNGAPEDTFFRFEMIIADRSREGGELTVLRREQGHTPWGGVTVNSQVPKQLGRLELWEQESRPKGRPWVGRGVSGVGECENFECAHLLSHKESGLGKETEVFYSIRPDDAPLC